MNGSNKLLERTSGFSQVDFVCGWTAACIETCTLFPIVKVTFRQQLHGVGIKEAIKQVLFIKKLKKIFFSYLAKVFQHFIEDFYLL